MKKRANQRRSLAWSGILIFLAMVTPSSAADNSQAQDLYRVANGLFDQGRFAAAVDSYKAAIAEDPGFIDAYHNMALAAEMVDRKHAIESWRRFVEVAGEREQYKFDVARIRARVQILEGMPPLPESLQPARYAPEAGDYYWSISRGSEGEEWKKFPVKVYLGSAPQMKWQEGARQAFDTWAAVFPIQLVALPQQADIRLSWDNRNWGEQHVGEEMERVEIKREGTELAARRIAVISVDMTFNWGKDDMRAIVTHELGHALGIKGHSDAKKDIMYMEMQRKVYGTKVGGYPVPIWKSLVKEPSQRDINTLIRLYNHPGSSVRFK